MRRKRSHSLRKDPLRRAKGRCFDNETFKDCNDEYDARTHEKILSGVKGQPEADWVAVSTANEEVKKVFLNSVDSIPCYDSEIEMLDAHPEIEAVVLASENSEHLRQMKLCIERGIHILSMKIPTFDMAEYDEMIRLTEENGIVCQVELEMHYNPVIARLKEVIKSGAIGNIRSFNATECHPFAGMGVPVAGRA